MNHAESRRATIGGADFRTTEGPTPAVALERSGLPPRSVGFIAEQAEVAL